MLKKFNELIKEDIVWLLDLEDEQFILNREPKECKIIEELHYNERFNYNVIIMNVPNLGPGYECVVDDSETTLALTDPYWIVSTSKEEIMDVFNNPKKYGFKRK